MIEKEIDIINTIIAEAVVHGADAGGSYDQNEKHLMESINTWLEFKGLTKKYFVSRIETKTSRWKFFDVLQIVKK